MLIKKINTTQLKKLIREYSDLEDGFHIERHKEVLLVSADPDVYISRRALKHFVERRKPELLKNNSLDETVHILISMVLYLQNIFKNPDTAVIDHAENKTIYEKMYNIKNFISIRVVVEINLNRIEIKSLHFIKIKIPP